MATIIHERIDADRFDGLRISWGGIWGGVLAAMGTLLLLTALGLAIGVSSVDPGDTQAGTAGAAALVWSGLSLLIALFIGGMAATRLGMIFDKTTGVLEGALVWVLSFLIVLYLAGSGIRLVASGISGVLGGVGQAVESAAGGIDLSTGNVDQILARLRNPETARTISSVSGVPQQEVSETLNSVAQRAQAVRNDPAAVASEVREGTRDLLAQARDRLPQAAAQAQEGAAKTAWISFAALVISLLAAIGGSMFGRGRVANRLAHGESASAQASLREDDSRIEPKLRR